MENLGLYPPNTALMVLTDGINRYEIYLSSSLVQNATVRLRKEEVVITTSYKAAGKVYRPFLTAAL